MIRFVSFAIAAILAGATGGGGRAQELTSTRDRMTHAGPERGESARMDPVFRHTLACVIARQPQRTRNLLDTVPGTAAEDRIIGSFHSRLEQCYPQRLRGMGIPWNLLRGGIAEIYYHRAFPAGLSSAPADPGWAARWVEPRPTPATRAQMEMLHASARCVVVRRPALVAQALAAAPFSREETRAMTALRDDLSACLDAGVEFTASRQSLRGLLAEAALHYGELRPAGQ